MANRQVENLRRRRPGSHRPVRHAQHCARHTTEPRRVDVVQSSRCSCLVTELFGRECGRARSGDPCIFCARWVCSDRFEFILRLMEKRTFLRDANVRASSHLGVCQKKVNLTKSGVVTLVLNVVADLVVRRNFTQRVISACSFTGVFPRILTHCVDMFLLTCCALVNVVMCNVDVQTAQGFWARCHHSTAGCGNLLCAF